MSILVYSLLVAVCVSTLASQGFARTQPAEILTQQGESRKIVKTQAANNGNNSNSLTPEQIKSLQEWIRSMEQTYPEQKIIFLPRERASAPRTGNMQFSQVLPSPYELSEAEKRRLLEFLKWIGKKTITPGDIDDAIRRYPGPRVDASNPKPDGTPIPNSEPAQVLLSQNDDSVADAVGKYLEEKGINIEDLNLTCTPEDGKSLQQKPICEDALMSTLQFLNNKLDVPDTFATNNCAGMSPRGTDCQARFLQEKFADLKIQGTDTAQAHPITWVPDSFRNSDCKDISIDDCVDRYNSKNNRTSELQVRKTGHRVD